ncbi:MAG: PUA domain-containing protein, partial [Candidatus Hermodarchaeia archaeon]
MKGSLFNPPEFTQFSEELEQYLLSLFGTERTHQLANALSQPGEFFFLRTNTLHTTNEQLVAQLKEENVSATITDSELNVVALPIHPTGGIPKHDKIVIADKASSENLLLGSHLYRPGVISTDRFREGDEVTVVNP